jgi:hypothetical protein
VAEFGGMAGRESASSLLAEWLFPVAVSCKFLFPIKASILDGLADMSGRELCRSCQVSYRSRDLENPVVCARR